MMKIETFFCYNCGEVEDVQENRCPVCGCFPCATCGMHVLSMGEYESVREAVARIEAQKRADARAML